MLRFIVMLWITGCGDDSDDVRDVGPDVIAEDGPDASIALEIGAPAAPAPPDLTPCASGYRVVETDDGYFVCEPWPSSGREECSGAEAHFPGEEGCRTVGRACPEGDFPDDVPEDALYVALDAEPDGDGTVDAPFDSLESALLAAPDDATIVIGPGTHEALVSIDRAVTLRGVCAERTYLAGAPSASLVSGALRVEDMRIGSTLVFLGGDTLAIRGVVFETEEGVEAAFAVEGELVAEDVVVRGDGGLGFTTGLDAELTVRHAVFEGLFMGLQTGGDVLVEDSAFIGVETGIQAPGAATVKRTLFEGPGIDAITSESAQLEDVIVRGMAGAGLVTLVAPEISVSRAWFTDNGRDIDAHGSDVSLRDVLVVDTRASEDSSASIAVLVEEGGSLEIERVAVIRGHSVGVLAATGGAASARIEDLVVRDTQPRAGVGDLGRGLEVFGLDLELERASLAGNRDISFALFGPIDAHIEDLDIRGTGPRESDGLFGRAFDAQWGVTADVTRARFAGGHDVSVLASGQIGNDEGEPTEPNAPVTLSLTDVEIIDTLERGCADDTCADAPGGVGVGSYHESQVHLERFRIRSAALCGLQIEESGEIDATEGEVLACSVGACLGSDSYDWARISEGTVFRDNDRDVDSARLPVPDLALPARRPGD